MASMAVMIIMILITIMMIMIIMILITISPPPWTWDMGPSARVTELQSRASDRVRGAAQSSAGTARRSAAPHSTARAQGHPAGSTRRKPPAARFKDMNNMNYTAFVVTVYINDSEQWKRCEAHVVHVSHVSFVLIRSSREDKQPAGR